MRLATLRTTDQGTIAVRIDRDRAVTIPDAADVGALLADPAWRSRAESANGPVRALADVADADWAPVVPAPSKVVCVGLNYRNHILEMGRELPDYPTLFAKYPEALIGPFDPIVLPRGADAAVDWEAELAVVIGARTRRVDEAGAAAAIAGYAVINDVTMRDFQYRTPEWFQGKTFEATTPLGPTMITADELVPDAELACAVDGDRVQSTRIDDLVFSPAALVSYISQIFTLLPGDVIATGTPGGVGHARRPPRYLAPGSTLSTSIGGIGELRNAILAEA